MKKIILICFLSATTFFVKAQQSFTVLADGTSFAPATLNVNRNDEIIFNTSAGHPVVQVSQATWNANGTTPLPGGFSFPNGTGNYTANSVGTIYYVCTFHVDFGMKGQIIVNESTYRESTPAGNNFRIYPNPALDFVNIENFGNVPVNSIKIIDISGREHRSIEGPFDFTKDYQIDIAHLNKGVYFVLVDLDNSKNAIKLFKQ